jgi:outer membrane protein
MMRKSLILAVACLVLTGFSAAPFSHAGSKVGFVHLNRLVNESKMGQKAKAKLENLRKKKEAVLSRQLRVLNELRNDISQNGSKMTADERRRKVRKFQKANKEYQRGLADAKEEVVRQDKELVSMILGKADKILKKIAKKKRYTIILKDPDAIGHLDPSVDITDAVVKELNKTTS